MCLQSIEQGNKYELIVPTEDLLGLRSNPLHQDMDFEEQYPKLHKSPITLIKQLKNGKLITVSKKDRQICIIPKKAPKLIKNVDVVIDQIVESSDSKFLFTTAGT